MTRTGDSALAGGWSALSRTPLARVLWIGGLVLLLQIPVGLIGQIVGERRATSEGAAAEIVQGFGRAQTLLGPILVIPFRPGVSADSLQAGEERYAYFLPERLEIEGDVTTEVRYRGIFEVPVYRSSLVLRGSFARPDFERLGVAPEQVLWDRAEWVLELSDPRAIQNAATLQWAGAPEPLRPGTGPGWPDAGACTRPSVRTGARSGTPSRCR